MLNLGSALAAKRISVKAYAAFLGVSEKTAHNKITQKTEFTFSEVRKTKEELFPEYDISYLFSTNRPS